MYIILSKRHGSAVMNRTKIRIFDTNKEAEQWILDYCESPRDAYVIYELVERPAI
jgi:hypothetical protein